MSAAEMTVSEAFGTDYGAVVSLLAERARPDLNDLDTIGPGTVADQIVTDVVSEVVDNGGIERAAFVMQHSEQQPGEYQPFVSRETDAGVCEAMAFRELTKDVREELGEEYGYTSE